MTEAPRNGNNGTLVGAAASIARTAIAALPPAFLLLCLINVMFLGIVFWHEDHAATLRAEAINKMLDRCLVAPAGRRE